MKVLPHKKVGVILAGGASRRYGSPKALASVNGKLFYECAKDVVKPVVDEIVIVAHPSIVEQIPPVQGVTVVVDVEEFRGMGPLAGIYTAMETVPGEEFYVLACDMPTMETEIFQQLSALKGILPYNSSLIPVVEGRVQPLAAVYAAHVKCFIPVLLNQKKRRMLDLLQKIDGCTYVSYTSDKSIRCFNNVNTIEDFHDIYPIR